MQPPGAIAEAARQIASKQLSPVELTHTCLDRIARIDPSVHSFLLVTEERALADARAAEARIMRDGPKGPLDGIPIGYKDIYRTPLELVPRRATPDYWRTMCRGPMRQPWCGWWRPAP